jgi:hypothetical protein
MLLKASKEIQPDVNTNKVYKNIMKQELTTNFNSNVIVCEQGLLNSPLPLQI